MKVQDRLKRSRRQEKRGMERFGGVQNPRSGARWDRRNDGRTDTELVEFKRTDNRSSITLRYADLDALYRHALVESRLPVLVFELGGREWVVLPEPDYHQLVTDRPATGTIRDLREAAPGLAEPGEVLGELHEQPSQPVLRRFPTQQLAGPRGKVGVPGNPSGPPRPLPGPGGLSQLRDRQRGTVGRLGRVQRKRAASDPATEGSQPT